MSVFRIHNHGTVAAEKPTNPTNIIGWTATQHFENQLNNAISVGSVVGNIGTSIPSIFARALLFDQAFRQTGKADLKANGINQKIISECLDMLELLYKCGQDERLQIVEWIRDDQKALLSRQGNEGMKRLGQVINDNLPSIGNPDRLFLFYWEDISTKDGKKCKVLIGATSPLTIVFTSPNWKRELQYYGWSNEFKRLKDGSQMFDDSNLQPLSDRTPAFRDMLYDMRMAFDKELNTPLTSGLYNYLINSIGNMGWPTITQTAFNQKYACVETNNGTPVVAGSLPIPYSQIIPKPADGDSETEPSGYLMRPTVEQPAGADIPLVLSDAGLPNAHYIGGSKWGTTKIDEVKNRITSIYQRTLPGHSSVTYPFVYISDFVEDKIIKLPAPIDSTKFYTQTQHNNTGQIEPQQYLLPLKPVFFDFFRIEDMDKIISIKPNKNGHVEVSLSIPITDSNYKEIVLSKTYDKEHIHALSGNELGIYPFYKVTDDPSLNKYAVVSSGTPKLSFHNIAGRIINSQPVQRTRTSGIAIETNYYTVNETFDYIILSDNDSKGMIIPKMKEIVVANAATNYKFAIDFGTSNTMIAYNVNGGNEQVLSIKVSDYLTLLHPIMDTKANEYINRNFMLTPSTTQSDVITFPIKTCVCECQNFRSAGNAEELFGKINTGYNILQETRFESVADFFKYDSNLKWSLESDPGNLDNTSRVRHFCMSLLWLLKNKVLTEGGNPAFSVCLTFPESMINKTIFYQSGMPITVGMGTWQWAAARLGLTNIAFSDLSESEAPYYKLVTELHDMLIVDIGGGTTDMFFVVRSAGHANCYYQSVRFAGNDIWGDGYGVGRAVADNGFISYINQLLTSAGKSLDETISTAHASTDVMAVMFNRDADLLTSQKIMGNNKLRSVLLIHLTALLYHISRVIKKYDMPIPKVIAFSGMGSKYIKLIHGEDKRLKLFITEMLKMTTEKNVPDNFDLSFGTGTEAKENTALGAIKRDQIVAAAGVYDLSNANMSNVLEQGLTLEEPICYQDIFDDKNQTIYNNSKIVFENFITFLNDKKFARLVNDQFGFNIDNQMIDALRQNGEQSYQNVGALVPQSAPNATVMDSLFFWHIKDGLYHIAK